jgi:hypothetical protein
MEAGLGLLLWIFLAPVAEYIFQSNWNKVLKAQAGGVQQPQQPPAAEAPPQQAPPRQAQ